MASSDQSKDQINADSQPHKPIPKIKPQTVLGCTGSTMIDTNALNNRLAQLQSMQQKRGRKKKSFDAIQSLNKSVSNANRDRYYSLATKQDAKKIQETKQQEREQIIQMKNARMKKYIQSQKNEFAPGEYMKQISPQKSQKTQNTKPQNTNQNKNKKPFLYNPSVAIYNHRDVEEQLKRLKYQLANSKGEKFDLYTWLKPTKLLGEGAYAAVCEVIDTRTNKKYAIKKNRDVFSNVADARRILREIKLMTHLDHPHVLSLIGVIPPESHDRDTYKDCYLIMPKMDTTLSKVIRSKQKLSERHIQYFIYQIARGLEYMHSGGIIHRDLKPENILVNAADCKVKITDFGLSRGVRIDVDSPQKLTEYVVTRWYRAPEIMCCSRLYDYQIDTWSLGCIAAELYTRRPIFKGRNHIEQLQLIFHFMGTPTDLSWITTADAKKWIAGMSHKSPQDLNKMLPNSSKLAQDFVGKLLIINPHKRPDISTAIKHSWMKEFARDKDYRKCPVFNISFEYEASIKTSFGVRHMMYEELHKFHKLCVKKEHERMLRYQRQHEFETKNEENHELNDAKELKLEYVNTDHIIYVLHNHVFNEINDDKLIEHKLKIVECIRLHQLHGKKIIEIGMEKFSKHIATYCNDVTLQIPLIKLYKAINVYKYNSIPETVLIETRILYENDTTALANEIVHNEKQYQILVNDTSILEAEIVRNERLWQIYMSSLSGKQGSKRNQNTEKNQSSQSDQNTRKNDEKEDNRKDDESNNNQNNNSNNNPNNNNNDSENNNSGGDEKKDDKNDDKKNDKENDKKDDEKSYDISKLKQKMKLIQTKSIYKMIQNSVKHALNDNELMGVMYYCDSESACSKMKKAHRCIIKDVYWQETYYHCTHAIEKIYKVLHYKNNQFKQMNDMSQKLYHGSQEIQLNGYDKDQFFFKTITSFSTKKHIAKGFTKNSGMIFIINKAFEGLYNGDLRGANVQWLSDFTEYEYVILPTTYNKINETYDHGLVLNPMQNVYITSNFKTNKDPLKPHSDVVSTIRQISYTRFDNSNNVNNNYSEQLERKYESDFVPRQHRIRVKLCHIINCEFENADTIPSQQLDIRVFDEAELQHAYRCHPNFYLRLTTWTNTTENDMNKNIQWDNAPTYFMQITYIDPDLTDFQLHITTNEVSNKRKKIFVKEIDENNVKGTKIENVIIINKGKNAEHVNIEIDEKHEGLHLLGLYKNKHAEKTVANSNTIHLNLNINDNEIPPNNETYQPKCINLETLRIVKNEENNEANIYWNTPMGTYGEISYKIINHINETEREIISMLPYSIPLYYAFLPFKVCTIATIDEKMYESKPSQSIFICDNDH